jgi:hypothetical protein
MDILKKKSLIVGTLMEGLIFMLDQTNGTTTITNSSTNSDSDFFSKGPPQPFDPNEPATGMENDSEDRTTKLKFLACSFFCVLIGGLLYKVFILKFCGHVNWYYSLEQKFTFFALYI